MLDKKLNKVIEQYVRFSKEMLSKENLKAILETTPKFKGWLCFEDPELTIPVHKLLRSRKGFMYVEVKTDDLRDRTGILPCKLPYFNSMRLEDTRVLFFFPMSLYSYGWWLIEDKR